MHRQGPNSGSEPDEDTGPKSRFIVSIPQIPKESRELPTKMPPGGKEHELRETGGGYIERDTALPSRPRR
jgi:hypothetical protein